MLLTNYVRDNLNAILLVEKSPEFTYVQKIQRLESIYSDTDWPPQINSTMQSLENVC